MRALEEKVVSTDIDILDKFEHAGGPGENVTTTLQINLHYAEFESLKKPYKRYPHAM